jgi:hypothetical protein
MPINVIISEEKFFAELNNGSTFASNLTDFASHLKGGVLEKVKASFLVQVMWTSQVSTFYTNYDGATLLTFNSGGADFANDGFAVGDSIKISIPAGVGGLASAAKITGNITSITGGNMTLDSVSVVSGTLPTNVTQFFYDSSVGPTFITGLTDITALKYRFGLIENNEAFNTLSKLTNTDQIFLAQSINHGAPGTFSNGVSFGNNKAWETGSMEVAFTQLVADQDLVFNENTTQEFRVNHTFVINPVFRTGEEDSLSGIDIPPLDIYNGNKSLKYVFEGEFRTVLNNPNTSKIIEYDSSLGSVGYLDESFNGFANDYQITDLVYTDVFTAGVIDSIDVTTTTRVNFTLKGTGLMFTSLPIVVGHTAILDSLQYANSTQDYNALWVNETLRNTVDSALVNGNAIKGFTATLVDVNTIDVQFSVVFTATQQYAIATGQKYLLYCTFQDNSVLVDNGNKTTLRVAVDNYIKSNDLSGLFSANTFHQYPHPETYTQGVTTGFVQGKLFVEDGQMAYADLRLKTFYVSGNPEDASTQVTHSVYLNSLKFKIVAYNTVTLEWFNLRSLDIDLGGNVLINSGGLMISNYNLDTVRGYILENSDIFNYLKFKTGSLIGDYMQYHLEVGYKIPWQEWLALVGADTVFYDISEQNNGLNNNTSNYTFTNDYKLRFLVDAEVETNSIVTNYVIASGDFEAYNYETDDIEPDAYTCAIQTYDIDDNPLSNNIIDQAYTRIEATFTPTAGGELFPANFYGIIRLEPINATSDAAISEISTIIEAPTNSLLKQFTGSSRLATLTTSGSSYVVKCLVDTSLTSSGTQYKISAEFRAKDLEL